MIEMLRIYGAACGFEKLIMRKPFCFYIDTVSEYDYIIADTESE